ncbi:LamG-like jellyroll fold domain-containing protein [Lentzea californiensis]|uniref:LamG-like jellyroll fold domain-containing protein n=1 Tax=Lentzea californiensis TaxID=438851 RepID=UPI0021668E3C|nr:LamG-like jellyroll fold domain-containing protein [Lentzea californiensis]
MPEPKSQAPRTMPKQPRTEVKTGAQPTVATESFDPRFSKEIVGERDARTRVYANPDGTKTAQISAQPEFFRTPDGKWEPIDTTLVDDGGVVRNKAGAIGHRFAKKADSKALGEYRVKDGISVGFGVAGAAPVAGSRDGDLINYADVRAHSDVELQSTTTGIKETIVLKSKDAPTEWDFPLELKGLTASLDDKGVVQFKDSAGVVKAQIPHGFMEDSAFPQAGTGAYSAGVKYSLNERDGKTVLHVSIDKAWVNDPARVFPIKVDPSVEDQNADSSTFVQTGFVTPQHTMAELRAGTWDGGGNKAATYLNFGSVSSRFAGQYVLGAQLWLANIHSYSCDARDVNVYQVTQPWSANGIAGFPGPGYGALVGSASFSYAYSYPGSACPNPQWAGITLNQAGRDLVNSWVHGGANYGLTVRTSERDSYAWKKFASKNSANPPKLAVTYSPYWATYQLPQGMTTPISSTQDGVMPVTVTNWGKDVWTSSNNYQLTYHLYDGNGVEQPQSMTYHVAMPYNVGYGQSATINMPIKKLPPGNWTIRFDMDKYGTTMFAWQGVPTSGTVAITIGDQYPIIDAMYPAPGEAVESLTPVLRFQGHDPDNYPSTGTAGRFWITDENDVQVADSNWVGDGQSSGFGGEVSWTVPAGTLKWGKTYKWSASIGSWGNNGPTVPAGTFTTAIRQPAVLSHAGAAAIEAGRGFDPVTRNYTTEAVDAVVKTVGPDLSVVRTYNSVDTRRNLAFGMGWSSRYDAGIEVDSDGTGNVVITYPDGQQVRFGRNNDGTYAPPPGRFATLTTHNGGWKLIDKSAMSYVFDSAGKLTSLTDNFGRAVNLTYTAGKLASATNVQGGRSLTFQWTGDHVTSVSTDPTGGTGTQLIWNYTYDGDLLTKVCDPANACTDYAYTPAPSYQGDLLPRADEYLLLNDAGSGTTAANQISGHAGATYTNVTASSDNPFGPGGTGSAVFNGTSSVVKSTGAPLAQSVGYNDFLTISAWFKTTSAGGVLIGNSIGAFGAANPQNVLPVVYIGKDGRLHDSLGTVSPHPVTDGKWHHVDLTLDGYDGTSAELRLDGEWIGERDNAFTLGTTTNVFIGGGLAKQAWPSAPTGTWSYFKGQIAHFSVAEGMSSPYTWSDVGASLKLKSVTAPGGRVTSEVRYQDYGVGRISYLDDRNGGTWWAADPDTDSGTDHWLDQEQSEYYFRAYQGTESGWFGDETAPSTTRGLQPYLWHDDWGSTQPGPFGEAAATFPRNYSTVGDYSVSGTRAASIELWFKTSSADGGALIGTGRSRSNTLSEDSVPVLYVGVDGKLRGRAPDGQMNMITSAGAVNDGNWHHVVLSTSDSGQALYLDGAAVGTLPAAVWDVHEQLHVGWATTDESEWPAEPVDGDARFQGSLTHLSTYRRALTPAQVSAHYAARTSQETYKNAVRADVPNGFYSYGAGDVVADPQVGHATFTDVQLDAKMMTRNGTSGTFNGMSSHVKLPDWQLNGRVQQTTDLWFNTSSTAGGVLVGTADRAIGDGTPQAGHAVLYLGTDGKLRGSYGSAGTPLSTVEAVNDGQWHHVALVGLGTSQVLYLDGKVVGHLNGTYADDEKFVYAGAGWLGAVTHPNRPADDWGRFNGTISNLAFQSRSFTGPEVMARQRAGKGDKHEVRTGGPNGRAVYGFDHANGDRLIYKSDPNGDMQYFDYDARGFMSKTTDANGNTITTGHDDRGNLVSQSTCRTPTQCNTAYYSYFLNTSDPTDPRNDLLLTSRDARSASKDDTSFLTTYAYTDQGDVESVRGPSTAAAPEGAATTNQYTTGSEAVPAFSGTGTQPPGLLKSTTNAANGVTSFAYNRLGDLVETVDPAGKVTRYAYDGIGRPVSETVLSSALPGDSVTTTTTYDGASRPLTTTGPPTTDAVSGTAHRLRITNTYNPDGTLASRKLEDVAGNDAARTMSYTYDDRGRVATVTDPENAVTAYFYDSSGNVTKTVDALAHETEFTYTPTNQPATIVVKGFNGDGQPARDVTFESRAYDPAGRLASVTDAMGRTTAYKYFDDGLVSSTVRTGFRNPDGSRRDITLSTHAYDGAGNEIRTEKAGVVTEREFDAAGNPVRVVADPAGAARSTDIAYDVLNNPVTVTRTDTAGTGTEVTEFGYDAVSRPIREAVRNGAETLATTSIVDQAGLPISSTDPRGNAAGATASQFRTDFAVDAYGRVVTQTSPPVSVESAGGAAVVTRPVTTLGYNTFGEAVSVKDPNGKISTSEYDKAGRQTSTTRPAYTAPGGTAVTSVTATVYDKLGRPTSVTDAALGVTGYEYDVLGNLTKRTDPVVGTDPAGVSTFRYTPLGELLGTTGATGAVVSSTFDDLGREVTSTVHERFPAPGRNLTTTTTYNDTGTIASVKAPNNAVTMHGYNGLGELTSTKDPAGKTTSVVRDFAGRVTRSTDPLGLKVDTAYDPAGRAIGTTWRDAAGQALRSTSAGYDAAGNTTSMTDPLATTTTRQWNALNQLVSETEPVSASATITIGFGYDAAGNQTRRTDGKGYVTTTTFNSWNLPESVIEPSTTMHPAASSRTWTTSYDAMGRPVRLALPGSVVRVRTYDALGNLTKETGTGTAASTQDRVLGYDRASRLTSASAGTGTNTYTYDDRGNLLTMAGPSGTGSYTYDDAARLTQRVDAAGATAYTYDPAGRIKTAADPRTGSTSTYTRDDAGRPTTIGYGTGNGSRVYTYDDLNRVVTDTVKNPAGQTGASIAYGYDNADRLTSKTTTGMAAAGTNTYGYDKANRLTSWDNGTNQVAYTWDDNGNRLTAGAVSATYDQRNRLLTSAGTSFDYSARGTLQSSTTSGTTVNHGYDAFDRLVTDGSATYTYDALDRRIGTGFAYSDTGNNLAADGTGTYSRLPDGDLLGITQGSTSALTYTDQHTDLVGTYTAAGVVSSSAAYTPHGEVIGRTGITHSLGYESGWTDPSTGRVNRAARWYTPGTGTFASRDDISGPGGLGHSAYNRYLYGAGDPLNMTDPTGHFNVGGFLRNAANWTRVAVSAAQTVAITAGALAAVGTFAVMAAPYVLVGAAVMAATMYLGAGTASAPTRRPNPTPRPSDRPGSTQEPSCRVGAAGCGGRDPGPMCTGSSCRVTPPGTTPTTGWRPGPCSVTPCRVPPVGPTKEELDEIAARAQVLKNALTPLVKPPSGVTLSPEIDKLINDATTVVMTVVGGQTAAQGEVESTPGVGPRPGVTAPAQGKLTNSCQHGGYQRPDYSSGGLFRGAQIWSECDVKARDRGGVATMDKRLPDVDGMWLRGSHGNAARIPGQVAKVLEGRSFDSFNDFRRAFWQAVAADASLAAPFGTRNLSRMADGNAPFVHASQQYGGQKRYVLHHLQPIQHEGGVYDLNNIIVATPRYHAEVLSPKYHYGSG